MWIKELFVYLYKQKQTTMEKTEKQIKELNVVFSKLFNNWSNIENSPRDKEYLVERMGRTYCEIQRLKIANKFK